jgi:hypothetical protein
MSALQTLLVTVGVFLLACGMARPQAQPATSSAHARVEWQSRKVTILSTRSGVGTAGATDSLKDGMQTSPDNSGSSDPSNRAKAWATGDGILYQRAKVFTQLTDSQQKTRSPLPLF